MATSAELINLRTSDLMNDFKVAVSAAASKVIEEDSTEPNHANRLAWALSVLAGPDAQVERVFTLLVGKYAETPLADIQAVTRQELQATIEGTINALAGGA